MLSLLCDNDRAPSEAYIQLILITLPSDPCGIESETNNILIRFRVESKNKLSSLNEINQKKKSLLKLRAAEEIGIMECDGYQTAFSFSL